MHDNHLARYDRVTIGLHWLIGLSIFLIGIAELLREPLFAKGHPMRVFLGAIHQPAGMVVFALILLRVVWRLSHRAPALPADMTGFEALTAKLAHLALYALMLAVPVAGIATQFARNRGIDFGIFVIPVPAGFPTGREVTKPLKELHEILGEGLLLIAFVHALAAIWHHRIRKDDVLTRMLPQRG